MVQRLYVGRLPEDVTKAELLSRFERLLTGNADMRIEAVELMANSAASDFAYLQVASATGDATAEAATIDAFVKAYHNTKWKGKRLRVEPAKPDYLQRLKLAWADDAAAKAEVLALREQAFAPVDLDGPPVLELKKSKRFKGQRIRFGDDGRAMAVAKTGVKAVAVSATSEDEAMGSDESDEEASVAAAEDCEPEAAIDDAELSSETSDEDVDVEDDAAALSSETSDDDGDDADASDDGNDGGEAASDDEDIDVEAEIANELQGDSDDIDMEAEIAKELLRESDGEDIDMEAEIAKELAQQVASSSSASASSDDEPEDTITAPEEVQAPVDEAARKEAANARRLAALAERDAAAKAAAKKPVVAAAAMSKKIVFDSDDDDDDADADADNADGNAHAAAPTKKRGFLSDSDDDSDDDDDFLGLKRQKTEALFEFRPEFSGVEGKKLFEMQKRFGGDQRFRLDARFVEGDEFNDGVDASDAALPALDDSIQAWAPVAADAEEVASRAYVAETEAALEVLADLFPNMDVDRAKARLQRSMQAAPDLKQLGWLAAVKRYDPRDAGAQALERAPAAESDVEEEAPAPAPARKETPLPEASEERYFAATTDLSTMFSRVRANSEDGEEMEAAFDGLLRPAPAVASGGFSFASMFGVPADDVIEDKEAADETKDAPDVEDATWHFASSVRTAVADDSTDDEAADEEDEAAAPTAETAPRRRVADVLAFGKSFRQPAPWTPAHESDWTALRKTYTLDFRRKHKQALKNRKALKKQFQKRPSAKA
ncbi:hypothetical protein ACHHYP_04554 [Achlya hypogyna]|uniref:RRM domain-containing protein n=1 Tax=Achlya hypogyna TaxID=1202772 RepID=A0A1V9Z0V3_ACHHY|nr:hypothetical protein ACHHYP_04554 [Achlya hypogyna]